MPNKVEVILQLNIDKVSCPGVWLCQDGRVALLVFALGAGYQTRFLPPVFPLQFKDTFYFKKQFADLCTLENLSCILNDETIYCELIQTNNCCGLKVKPVILAQYLGSLSDVLFPPNVCITEGVDLLMKRTDSFPGILAPKVEISTRIRIDHSWNTPELDIDQAAQNDQCRCGLTEGRQQTVCHTPQYHRIKCARISQRPLSATRHPAKEEKVYECRYMRSRSKSPPKYRSCSRIPPPPYNNIGKLSQCVYRVAAPPVNFRNFSVDDVSCVAERDDESSKSPKAVLESRFIIPENTSDPQPDTKSRPPYKQKLCTCDICKRYFEMFHKEPPASC